MSVIRPGALGALAVALVLAACGPGSGGGQEPGGDAGADPTGSGPASVAVTSISVVATGTQRERGTVWTLERGLDGDRPGAAAAFRAAGSADVRLLVGGPRERTDDGDAYRVTIVWADGERLVVDSGWGGIPGGVRAVVAATRKAAEPVRG